MDDPKNFVLGKFFENVPKWSNSQSYHDKSDIWRLFNFSPAVGHPGWTLRKFSEDFFKKHDSLFIEIGVSDWLDIADSEGFWPFKLILINSAPVD